MKSRLLCDKLYPTETAVIRVKRKGGFNRKEQTLKKAPLLIIIIVILLLTSCSVGGKNESTAHALKTGQGSPVIVDISPATVIDTEPASPETGSVTADIPASSETTLDATETTVMLTHEPTPELSPTAFLSTEKPSLSPAPTPAPTPTPEPTIDHTYDYIERVISPVDFNGNGIDDYTDILIGARKDAAIHPRYDSSYQPNGYPPDDVGVCADVIWRALREAGYSLRYMVDRDIRYNTWRYPQIDKGKEKRDNKIDFRRVRNLRIFFDEYAVILTRDIYEIEEWQPGDIVIFNNNTHIGIVSDKRNERGVPYIIHNGGQAEREQDYLEGDHKVAAHYRFDASKIPEDMLIPWEG